MPFTADTGSPPQVRGKRCRSEFVSAYFRITPAGAGKTYNSLKKRYKERDHPRRCGENSYLAQNAGNLVGSPPQVRGKQNIFLFTLNVTWITPAGAGKTTQWPAAMFLKKDHPRRCGENLVIAGGIMLGRGSPPQVRGKPIAAMIALAVYRITPAGAGKTTYYPPSPFCNWDHPRRCGENPCRRSVQPENSGSPPQVRGKH